MEYRFVDTVDVTLFAVIFLLKPSITISLNASSAIRVNSYHVTLITDKWILRNIMKHRLATDICKKHDDIYLWFLF